MTEAAGNFQRSLDVYLRWEGGWNNVSGDKGGETIFGISRKSWPNWAGWAVVDADKSSPNFPRNANNDPTLRPLVEQFYRENFWNPVHGDELPWRMAMAVFDMAGNSGDRAAIRQMQASLGVEADGIPGPKTIKAAWDGGKSAVEEFLTQRIIFYVHLMINDPTQRMWGRNWVKRIIALSDEVLEG